MFIIRHNYYIVYYNNNYSQLNDNNYNTMIIVPTSSTRIILHIVHLSELKVIVKAIHKQNKHALIQKIMHTVIY